MKRGTKAHVSAREIRRPRANRSRNEVRPRVRLPQGVRTLAVFGGTFDPVHLAHLVVAQELLDQEAADQVLFVPAYLPPHKVGEPISSAEHRLAMVRHAVRGNPRFTVSDVEVRKGGPSYTIDTLRVLRANLPPHVRIALIVGADQAQEFETWRDYRELVDEFPLILTTRAGYPGNPRRGRPYLRSARVIRIPDLDISSTAIRQRVAEGKSIRYLVPKTVEDYIRRHGLYRRPSP